MFDHRHITRRCYPAQRYSHIHHPMSTITPCVPVERVHAEVTTSTKKDPRQSEIIIKKGNCAEVAHAPVPAPVTLLQEGVSPPP